MKLIINHSSLQFHFILNVTPSIKRRAWQCSTSNQFGTASSSHSASFSIMNTHLFTASAPPSLSSNGRYCNSSLYGLIRYLSNWNWSKPLKLMFLFPQRQGFRMHRTFKQSVNTSKLLKNATIFKIFHLKTLKVHHARNVWVNVLLKWLDGLRAMRIRSKSLWFISSITYSSNRWMWQQSISFSNTRKEYFHSYNR